MTALAIGPCDHVLCHPQAPPPRTQPINLPPSTRWRDLLDTAEIREARAARMAAQARGFGLQRDPVLSAERIPTGCGCPAPADGMVPTCYWTGHHAHIEDIAPTQTGGHPMSTYDEARRAAAVQALEETHGSAAYLADNLAAVTIERDEFAAEAEQLRAELDRYRRCPACRQTQAVAA